MSEPEQAPQQSPQPLPPIPSPTGRVKKSRRTRKSSRFECPYCHFRFGLSRKLYWKYLVWTRCSELECPQCQRKSIPTFPQWAMVVTCCVFALAALSGFIMQIVAARAQNPQAFWRGAALVMIGPVIYSFLVRVCLLHLSFLVENEEDNQ